MDTHGDSEETGIDPYDFKPLGRGLGFHQDESQGHSKISDVIVNPHINPQGKSRVSNGVSSIIDKDTLRHPLPSSSVDMPSEFVRSIETQKKQKKISSKRKRLRKPTPEVQFIAWLLDVFCVAIICVAIAGSFLLIAGIGSSQAYSLVSGDINIMAYMGIMVAVVYVAYFTYSDLDTSIGKRILRLRMVPTDGGGFVNSGSTFVRALVSLFSIVLFGVPSLFDFQGKLSDTMVIKK